VRILLTGGCGFIGSHTAVALVDAGYEPVLLDNFSNSVPDVIDRLAGVIGRKLTTIVGDVRDVGLVRSILAEQRIDAVIHFAALKAVAQSVAVPLEYYINNVGGMLALLEAMQKAGVRNLVFSSSATVYGEPQQLPIEESHPKQASNPYGEAKLMCEKILADLVNADQRWCVSLLRYFNPVGAHPSALLGEHPKGVPNNLMPLLVRAARRKTDPLPVYGTDYPTVDGSAVRDYVHVVDLAEGHVAALNALKAGETQAYNLGTGRGTSVLELIATFEKATGVNVPYVEAPRRAGDVAELYAATEKAERILDWRAKRGLAEMCADSWRFAARIP
jgi:UDP-glucose 4-epimerase